MSKDVGDVRGFLDPTARSHVLRIPSQHDVGQACSDLAPATDPCAFGRAAPSREGNASLCLGAHFLAHSVQQGPRSTLGQRANEYVVTVTTVVQKLTHQSRRRDGSVGPIVRQRGDEFVLVSVAVERFKIQSWVLFARPLRDCAQRAGGVAPQRLRGALDLLGGPRGQLAE